MQNHLAGAVELSCFELGQAIIFALFIILTVMNASSERQTVIVYASVYRSCDMTHVRDDEFDQLRCKYRQKDPFWLF